MINMESRKTHNQSLRQGRDAILSFTKTFERSRHFQLTIFYTNYVGVYVGLTDKVYGFSKMVPRLIRQKIQCQFYAVCFQGTSFLGVATFPGLPARLTLQSVVLPEVQSVRKQAPTDDMKIPIAQEIANIDGEMLERATPNFRERLEACIERDGHLLKDIIFKTI
ncbi:hypothetical protein ANN_10047 [Periplaneta americana]|uniref:Uncharacterized protein n=1 Tax=Periplaneta americana TaxID=6978 RepID=A0ABQ8TRP0_PERAM|nr:hypothetical protein ANN_10047 [Periplaneta americana]